VRIGIVGAGLAGLVASLELAHEHDVTVYEESDEVGGRVRTVLEDDFVFDRGFQVLFTAYPEARRYLDYDALDLREFDPGARIASEDGVSTLADPLRSPKDALPSLLSDDATFADKLRLLRLRLGLQGADRDDCFTGEETTIRDYLDGRGFSSVFIESFAEPFYGGITLDRSLGTSSHVFEFTFSCLSSGRTVVPAEGMGAIPQHLASKAREEGAEFETNVRVRSVSSDGTVETPEATHENDAVVVATDPAGAERLTDVSTPDGAKGCVTQYYVADESLGVGKKILLNADRRDGEPNQLVPVSSVVPEHSPDGTTLVSATFLGDEPQNRDDEELSESTRGVLGRWGSGEDFDVSLETVHTARVPLAQFEQNPGFADELPSQDAPDGNVFLAGDYTHDSSINGAMLSGRRVAQLVSDTS